jgi:uncharacterized membrane protein YczE
MDFASFREFVALGFGHITASGAMDHILFLVALAAIYRWNERRQALVVVTAFTVGHSITLSVAVLAPDLLPSSGWIEFLIPVTIVATGVENLSMRAGSKRAQAGRRAVLAGGFGLVHGAGFAGYLSELMPGAIGVPLFGFNVGIELGQAIVLAAAIGLLAGVDRGFSLISRDSAFRLRVAAVSLMVALVGGLWALERAPW